ncbi:S9 family peptidase [Undibacterium fentianense]|uniref:S9 family peptidase n=1 Tax=Undibacterium fentianense TaxID=2828728 RepID=A0A941E3D7_9BURK|nr:S9 family peptidase [Undibacterium fentianense]MBR7800337.1 S9 family peptidase [Undibacterium fentianense]
MKQKLWKQVWVACTFACLMPNHVMAQSTPSAPPAIENFFKLNNFGGASLSPDGKSVSILMAGPDQRLALAIMDTETSKLQVIAKYSNLDIVSARWVNNTRLVFSMGDRQLAAGQQRMGPGLIAIDKDGKNEREIIERNSTPDKPKFRVLTPAYQFHSVVGKPDSNDVYVVQGSGNRRNPALTLFRVNTTDGVVTGINSPINSVGFMTDYNGDLRIATTRAEKLTTIQYKDPKNDTWRTLIEFDSVKEDGFAPEAIGPDGSLYVTAHNGKDTKSVYKYDLENNRIIPEPLIELDGFDFSGDLIFSKKLNKIIGVRYETDAVGTLWLHDSLKKIQAKVDALLPSTINNISTPRNQGELVLVNAFSDTVPGLTFLYHTVSGKLTPLGVSRPDINEKQMSYTNFVKIKARDGLEIPTYVTLPRNSDGKNLPLIVMVHGGPYVRGGHWQWNAQTQLLASRGYAVIEPDFRGSEGYGKKLFQAGWKQWGLKMQDDLDDARQWAIDQGYADAKRVCIAGASYGGYATLMGLIRNPDLYRCGISWVGVSDINLLYNVSWSDNSEQWQKYGMPFLIGDQEKDAAQLKATSPLEQAARLKNPLILAYGAADYRVPLVHGTKFYDAIKGHNKDVEWIVYNDEGHGWRRLDNNLDFWSKVEKFLEKYLRQ